MLLKGFLIIFHMYKYIFFFNEHQTLYCVLSFVNSLLTLYFFSQELDDIKGFIQKILP